MENTHFFSLDPAVYSVKAVFLQRRKGLRIGVPLGLFPSAAVFVENRVAGVEIL